MDETDPTIVFDAAGICNHCHDYDRLVARVLREGSAGQRELEKIADAIRTAGRGKSYDCLIGLSGGVDSSYVAYKVKELGLRPLAVHVDNGWDSEIAVRNIEHIVQRLGIDLKTEVLDWDEFRDLQLAFLRASTPDSDIPADHAILATMYHTAREIGTRYIIWGSNAKTETHLPHFWSTGHTDWRYIRTLYRRFGSQGRRLRTFPRLTYLDLRRLYRSMHNVNILDYLDYSKPDAIALLEEKLGWRSYGGKHCENTYTKFYQGYILPRKFGYDKRKVHYSSAICSGQMSRARALELLAEEPYPVDEQRKDREYVVKKLGVDPAEFDEIMRRAPKSFSDYPSYARIQQHPAFRWLRHVRSLVIERA
jgi:N-acetyl sugar amidotransferase